MPKRRSLRLAEKAKRLEEEVKGQEVEERKIKPKKPRVGSPEPSKCTLDFNPFLVEPILRKLLKKLDKVAQLKELRKMCDLWDNVNMEELEERAFKGKLKAIDFEWKNWSKSQEEAEKEFVGFLDDTRSIPRLFNSFKFNIPYSPKVLQGHTSFFSDYTISRVELSTLYYMEEFKDLQAPMEYFLSLIGPNLKEIQMKHYIETFEQSSDWPKPEQELIFPNLQKIIIGHKGPWVGQLTEFFKSALSKGGPGNGHITSLELSSLPGADIGSFPGLDPARMTHLDLSNYVIDGSALALKLTTGLMTLVEKGMSLVEFGMKVYSDEYATMPDTTLTLAQNLPRIASNMTHFFATQSSTLTTLHFELEFFENILHDPEDGLEADRYGLLLQLPVFPVLHTLYFAHFVKTRIGNLFGDGMVRSPLFKASSPLHFPALVNVTFDTDLSMRVLGDNYDPDLESSRYHFQRLELEDDGMMGCEDATWNLYGALIESIEYLNVPGCFLSQIRIPWADSLRELCTLAVEEPLKLSHLKKLETLTIYEYRFVVREKVVPNWDHPQETLAKYLSWFVEVPQLSLNSIKFVGLEMMEEEEDGIKEEFNRYFPFPVQFEY